MNTRASHAPSSLRNNALTVLAACMATLFALPVKAAIDIPSTPIQIGAQVPPNITLILDTSGSMEWDYLIDDTIDIEGGDLDMDDFDEEVYTYNRAYYNPNIDYDPWSNYDGTLRADTPYTAVYTNDELASGTTTNLLNSTRTFYAPKPTATDLNDALQYYRYQILTDGKVVRSERLEASVSTTVLLNVSGLSAGRDDWVSSVTNGADNDRANNNDPPDHPYTVVVPADIDTLVVTLTGNDSDANLYVRYNAAPTVNTNNCRRESNDSNETCTLTDPTAGTWYIGVLADNGTNADAFSNVQLRVEAISSDLGPNEAALGCSTSASGWGWRNCTETTHTGRSAAEERQNFATWYSFHRTRMKSAKAGISVAFSDLGENFRVGLAGLSSINTRIPVGTDGGLFRERTSPASTNRSSWFTNMFAMTADGGTPLRSALNRVGTYYTETGNDGPYGGTGDTQLACRANFAILTTDGYWNGDSGYDNSSTVDGDEDAGTEITGPNDASYTYTPVLPYSASQQGTLADVAMQYWKQDLRAGANALDNIVPTSTGNPAFWQHMVTFGISLGLKGNLDPDVDLPAITAGTKDWGVPASANDNKPENIDDLWHAAVNSRGSFVAATDPQQFANALRSALAAVVERTASSSNVAANSTSLNSGTRLFQARYVSSTWIGELLSYPVDAGGVSDTASWSASSLIPAPGSRTILTWNGTGGEAFPTAAQAAALNSPTAGVTDYLKGVRTGEGTTFRSRVHVLGDIVNSSPVYVKDTDTVYVGANDGMLHAFDAETGVELFGYVPGNIDLASLESYANPNYAHAFTVDGPIAVSTQVQTPNKNYLIGSLGRGGKGVFGLDVTNPDSFANADVEWDFDATNHDLMGNVLGRPIIAKLNNGDVGVIVANGPNSTNDTAVLYVLDITDGSVLAEINTGVGSSATPNGLSTPRGWDNDGNGTVDYVYAGDLLGNFWRFDLSATNDTQWSNAANRYVMYQAEDADGNPQPISGSPSVAMDPVSYNTWVFFGTGRLLTNDDVTNADGTPNVDVQTWYGLKDTGATIAGRDDLQERVISVQGAIDGKPVRAFEPAGPLEADVDGWYIDLVTPPDATAEGERMIGDSSVVGTTLIAASVVPSADTCGGDGTGFINALNAFTGASVTPNFFDVDGDGDFSDDVLTDADGNVIPVGSVNIGVDMPTSPTIIENLLVAGGSDGSTGEVGVNNPANQGRISWREIVGD